jgi:hypothetical protein
MNNEMEDMKGNGHGLLEGPDICLAMGWMIYQDSLSPG